MVGVLAQKYIKDKKVSMKKQAANTENDNEPIVLRGDESNFLENVKDLFPEYTEYVIDGYTSDEGDFWTGFQSSTCGYSTFSCCARFGSGVCLRNDEILSGLLYLMRHTYGLEKHWELLKFKNHSYYLYIKGDILEPAYFINHKLCFENNKEDKKVIKEYLKNCKEKDIPVDIIRPMKGTSLSDCRFTQVGKDTNNECWWDGQRHRYLVGRPDNLDERLYPDNPPYDDRKRYQRWA